MSTITKEQAHAISDLKAGYTLGQADVAILNELARIALASLEAEPVAYVDPFAFNNFSVYRAGDTDNKRMGREWMWANPDAGLIPVFTAPPVPVSDNEPVQMFGIGSAFKPQIVSVDEVDCDNCAHYQPNICHGEGCPAAMLQGAEQPQNAQQNIPENIPATQFKPVADLYGISIPGGRATTYSTDAAEASDCRVMGWAVQEYVKLERYQDTVSGNSPVIPDGLRLALSNAGIAAPESDEMLAATCEKHIQELVAWVKDRKPFQPAQVAMKDHQIRELVNELRDIAIEYHGTQQLRERMARAVRAAMLQGAEPVTMAYKLPANTPCKEAPEHIWLQTAGVWPENGEFSELTWCSDNQHEDDTLYVRADVVTGNSPVIQDGWVLVPVEPTEHMIVEGFESWPDEFFSDTEVWEAFQEMSGCQQSAHLAKLCWAAMIAAAPQQEAQ